LTENYNDKQTANTESELYLDNTLDKILTTVR